jgi:hypothetical protein
MPPRRCHTRPCLPPRRRLLQEAVEVINSTYPEEIVQLLSPAYSRALLEKLDAAAAATVQAVA